MNAVTRFLARDTETDQSPPYGIHVRHPNTNPLIGFAVCAGPIARITVDPKLGSAHAKLCVSRVTVDISKAAYFLEPEIAGQPVNHLVRVLVVEIRRETEKRWGIH